MVFKQFNIQCTIRILFLCVTIYFFFYLLFQAGSTLYATMIILGGLSVYQAYSLLRYVEKTNRDLTRFLQSIRYSDFSQTFSKEKLGSSFDELNQEFGEVINEFRQARAEKEEHFRYLQTVVQHVGVGLIAFQQDGNVELINSAAKKLFKLGTNGRPVQLKNIRALEIVSKALVDALFELKSGENTLVKIEDKNDFLQLAISATEFRLRGYKYTLVSLQNIHSELEEKEMEAWQNLIRVLTHEIMNSVTPISSLASTLKEYLPESIPLSAESIINEETIADLRDGVQTIEKRSQGLLHFVDTYRNLTRLPKPNFQILPVNELFKRVQKLLATQFDEQLILLQVSMESENLKLVADLELLEQVLINLLMNAVQAVENCPDARIELSARIDERSHVLIQVMDNGPGMDDETMEKIFIPFFTTKQEGSGIGLSLSRQIMRLHRGSISVHSVPNKETVFTLRF